MIRLDVGLRRSQWGFRLGCQLPFVLAADLLVGTISLMFIRWGEYGPLLSVPFLLWLVAYNAMFAASLARSYGRGFWLDGRVLIRRSVTGREYYDLSVAHVRAESVAPPRSSHL